MFKNKGKLRRKMNQKHNDEFSCKMIKNAKMNNGEVKTSIGTFQLFSFIQKIFSFENVSVSNYEKRLI